MHLAGDILGKRQVERVTNQVAGFLEIDVCLVNTDEQYITEGSRVELWSEISFEHDFENCFVCVFLFVSVYVFSI